MDNDIQSNTNDPEPEYKTSLRTDLENIESAIKQSWFSDIDATSQMKDLLDIQQQILDNETFEGYFESKNDFQYFIGQFTDEVLVNILRERPVPGEDGDDIALQLLVNYILFYMKYHNETALLPLWPKMRNVLKQSEHFFMQGNGHQIGQIINNPKRTINANEFNRDIYSCSDEYLQVNDRCDFYYYDMHQHNEISKHCYLRGTITNKDKEYYYIVPDVNNESEIRIDRTSIDVLYEGTLTEDWEWRLSLKEYDVVDCFVNGRYKPAMILNVEDVDISATSAETTITVYKRYTVGFRIIINKCENYKSYAKYYDDGCNEKYDGQLRKYIGDNCELDEVIEFYDLRLQKPNTKIKEHKRMQLLSSYTSSTSNASRQMNAHFPYYKQNRPFSNNSLFSDNNTINNTEDEEDDILHKITDTYIPYVNSDDTKNYIVAKRKEFSYYYASLLKLFASYNGYENIINILSNETTPLTSENIYNVFYILQCSLPYLHTEYLINNYTALTQGVLKYIDNISSNEMRNLKKELCDIIIQVISRIESRIGKTKLTELTTTTPNAATACFTLIDEFTLKIAIKMINSSIFDKRLQGVKLLNDYLQSSKDNDDIVNTVLSLMKHNNIIKEIFGVNSHSQIIAKSHDIIAMMLDKHALTNDDLELILSGTQKGDLDGKLTIMNMLKDLSHCFVTEQRQRVLTFIYKHIDITNIKEKEIEVIYHVSSSSDNVNDVTNCINFFMECIMKCNVLCDDDKTNALFIEKVNEIAMKSKQNLIHVCNRCVQALKDNVNAVMCYKILLCLYNKLYACSNGYASGDEVLASRDALVEYFKGENDLLMVYKNNFKKYKEQAKMVFNNGSSSSKVDGFSHSDNIMIRLMFVNIFISSMSSMSSMTAATERSEFNVIKFLIDMLYNDPVCDSDRNEFFKFSETILSKININTFDKDKHSTIINELFNLFSNKDIFQIQNINDISLRVFCITFLYINIQHNKLTSSSLSSHEEDSFSIFSSSSPSPPNNNTPHLLTSNKDVNDILLNTVLKVNPDELIGFDLLWNIILTSTHYPIVTEALKLLQALYNKNNQSHLLLSKCTDAIKSSTPTHSVFPYKKYFDIINILFLESESKGIPIIKSHNDLLKQSTLTYKLNYINTRLQNETCNVFTNTTLSELKINIAQSSDVDYNDISLEYHNEPVPLNVNCVPASKILNDVKDEIYVRIRERRREDLIDSKTGKPVSKYLNIINEWFDLFSEGTERMTAENIRAFTERVTSNKKDVVKINDSRVVNLLERYHSRERGYITRDNFLEFYITAARDKPVIVWENLVIMGYRENLTKKVTPSIVDVSSNDNYARFTLGNDDEFVKLLFEMFNNVNECSVRNDIYEFVMNLCTNGKVYDMILNELDKESNVVGNMNELVDLYKMHIVESIIEDVKFEEQCDKGVGYDVDCCCNVGKWKEGMEKKKEWIQCFYESGQFGKLIPYVCGLIKKMKDVNNDKENNITVVCLNYAMRLLFTFFSLTLEGNQLAQVEMAQTGGVTASHVDNNNNMHEANTNDAPAPPQSQTTNANNNNNNSSSSMFSNLHITYNIDDNDQTLNEHLLQLMHELISFITLLTTTTQQPNDNNTTTTTPTPLTPNINKVDIKSCFLTFISILLNKPHIFESIQSSSPINTALHDLITTFLMSRTTPQYQTYFNKTLLTYTQIAYDNKHHSILFYLYSICLNLFKELLTEDTKSSDASQATSFSLFFDYFTSLYEKIGLLRSSLPTESVNNYIHRFNIGSDEFIINLYDSVVDFVLSDNKETQKISGNLFIGVVKLLIKGIQNSPNTKQVLFTKKRNDVFIFDELVKFLTPSSDEQDNVINTTTHSGGNSSNSNNEFISLSVINNENNVNTTFHNQKKVLCEFISTLLNDNTLYSAEYFINNSQYISELLTSIEKEQSQSNTQQQQESGSKYYYLEMMHRSDSTKCRSEGYVGLKNLGCICYMNSIMQQIYMVPTFRYAILQSDDHKPIETSSSFDDNLLHQLQRMYTYLLFSQKEYYNPKMFCSALKDMDGNATNVLVQQDSQEFLNSFCDKIETHLKHTEFKYIINDVFVGRTCSQVICDTCKHVSNRFEDFYNLTLEVKNINNLNESLEKMILPEKIGDFNCENCKNKVTITKRTTLADLPNVLIVHLRRFWMNYEYFRTEKINSSFTFPSEINLKKFCLEDLMSQQSVYETDEIYYKEDEYYEYTLKGVTVHIGTADGGHYFSYINVNREKEEVSNDNETWLKFNDSRITKFDAKDIPEECFGGMKEIEEGRSYEKMQNAYLLIYERKLKSPIRYVHINTTTTTTTGENTHNVVEYNETERNKIKKENDISRKQTNTERNELQHKLSTTMFHDIQKNECYIYKDFYSLDKMVPLSYYKQVHNENKLFMRNQNKDNSFYDLLKQIERNFTQHIQEHPEMLFNADKHIKESLCETTLNKLFMLLSCNDNDDDSVSRILNDLHLHFSILTQLISDNEVNMLKFFSYLEKSSRFETLATLDKVYLPFIDELFTFLEKFLNDNINNANTKQYAYKVIQLILNLFTQGNILLYTKSSQFLPPFYALFYNVMKYFEQQHYEQIHNKFNIISFFIKALIYLTKDAENVKEYTKYSKFICESLFAFIMRLDIYNDIQFIPNEHKPYLNTNTDGDNSGSSYIHVNDINALLIELENETFLTALMKCNVELYGNVVLFLYNYQRNSVANEIMRIFKQMETTDNKEQYKQLYSIMLSLIQIKDNKSLERFTFILGYPEMNVEYTNCAEHIWPVFGYELYKRDNKSMYRYITQNHIESKYSLLQLLNDKFDYDIGVALLKISSEHYGVFKYLYLMPSNDMKYNNYYEWLCKQCESVDQHGNDMVKDVIEKNKAKEERVVKYVKEFIKKEQGCDDNDNDNTTQHEEMWELPGWKGYLTEMIPKCIVKENIKKLSSGSGLMFYLFEYITTTINVDLLTPSIKLLEERDNELKLTEQTANSSEPPNANANAVETDETKPTEEGTFTYKTTNEKLMQKQLTFNLNQRGYNERRFIKQLSSSNTTNNCVVTFVNPNIDEHSTDNDNVVSIGRFTIVNNSFQRGTLTFTKQMYDTSNVDNYYYPDVVVDSLIPQGFRDGFIVHSFRRSQRMCVPIELKWNINLNLEQGSHNAYSSSYR